MSNSLYAHRVASLSRRTEAQSAKRASVEAAVLEATERLLAGGASYGDLPVDRIAREAGISRTAFYFYFRDKRELLMRMTEEVMETLYAQAETWWGAAEGGAEALTEALRSIMGLYRTHGVLLRAVVEASAYDEEVARFWRRVVARFVEATRARIEGEGIVGIDPAATAFALAWMTERTAYQQLVQGREDDDALVGALVAVWRRTIYGG